MVGSGLNREEFMGSHTSRSLSRSGSHISHEENIRAMQLEIDCLKRKLRHELGR